MYPFIKIFNFQIATYGLCILLGSIFSVIFLIRIARKKSYDPYLIALLAVCCFAFGFFGAKLLFVLTSLPLILDLLKMKQWSFLFSYISGGFVFWGGLLTGALSLYLIARRLKFNVPAIFDLFSGATALAHGFGRIGCFFAGCCYGLPCKHGIILPRAISDAPRDIPLIPVQLIEAFFNFILCFVLWYLFSKKQLRPGTVTCIYLSSYSIFRFIIEFFRGDLIRGKLGIFSTSQWISLVILLGTIFYYYKKRPKKIL